MANRDRLLQLVLENVQGVQLAPPDADMDTWALVVKSRNGRGTLVATYVELAEADARRLRAVMTPDQLVLVPADEPEPEPRQLGPAPEPEAEVAGDG